ncbi:MAG: hypothetical protein R2932_09355 [Caldilineaceae bacterium]
MTAPADGAVWTNAGVKAGHEWRRAGVQFNDLDAPCQYNLCRQAVCHYR